MDNAASPVKAQPCVFPFKLGDTLHFSCTLASTTDGVPWCSTKTDRDGNHERGQWGQCGRGCKVENQDDGNDDGPLARISSDPDSGKFLPRITGADGGQCYLNGHRNQFVHGGVDSLPFEFPFATLIGYPDSRGGRDVKYFCGGTIINRRYILTAAHCLFITRENPASPTEVRVGEVDLKQPIDCVSGTLNADEVRCAPPPQNIEIEDIIIHEGYDNKFPLYNDIGLLRLKKPIELNNNTQPVCLPLAAAEVANRIDGLVDMDNLAASEVAGRVLGWGRTHYLDAGALRVSLTFYSTVQ